MALVPPAPFGAYVLNEWPLNCIVLFYVCKKRLACCCCRCRNILAIQQSLTNMTLSREPELDHARQYYELLYLKVDDILKVTLERGPQFSEQQYVNLLTLAQRSGRAGSEQDLDSRLARLSGILKDYEFLV